jgi:hypothetical protein
LANLFESICGGPQPATGAEQSYAVAPNGIPADGIPDDGIPDDGIPDDGIPDDGIPDGRHS